LKGFKALRTYLVNLALRALIKRKLSTCLTPFDVRKAFEGFPPIAPRGVRFFDGAVGGVSGEWAQPKKGPADIGTILYVHGGGHVAMSPRTHRAITGAFAARGFSVFAPDYRLAPEYIFPAALSDLADAFCALREQKERPIFVAGDSSGGGLVVSLLLKLRDLKQEQPIAASVFSPWVDLAVTGDSATINRDRDPVEVPECLRMLAKAYIGQADPRDPLISPIYGDLTGLPPLQIFVGDTEILLDDAQRLATRARNALVSVDLQIYPNMPHAWPSLNAILPEGRKALDDAALFMKTSALKAIATQLRDPKPSSAPLDHIQTAKTGT
jgi:monoterpene epsilon-lactone hydrolase